MTDRDLKRLSRTELLEMLIDQSEELEKLRTQMQNAQIALQNKRIAIEKSGSIAEAALALNGVFSAAQSAAEQYLENIQKQQEEAFKRVEDEARKNAEKIRAAAEEYSINTRNSADAYYKQVVEQAQALLNNQSNL